SMGGERIATAQSSDREGPLLHFAAGRQAIAADVDTPLLPVEFRLDVGLHHRSGTTIDYVTETLRLTALNAAEHGTDHYPWSAVRGYVRPRSAWTPVRAADPVAATAEGG